MVSINKIELKLKTISNKESVEIDGISFSNICYIEIFIDGENILETDLFYGSFIYFKELKKSILESGDYLIFTAVSGIADDLGWDYISIVHDSNNIIWQFERDDKKLHYVFNKEKYITEIDKLDKTIKNADINIVLEPVNVISPEE